MQDLLIAFSQWLAATNLSDRIRAVSWIVPVMQIFHIIAIATIMGTVVLIDLRAVGLAARSQALAGMVRRLLQPMWAALAVLLLSGSVLIIGEPNRALANPVFQLKMLLLLTAIALTLVLAGKVRGEANYWETSSARRQTARVLGGASLLVWLAIIIAGRWIAYVDLSAFG